MTVAAARSDFHVPVLLQETLASLNVHPGAVLIDCTLGDAGHTIPFLEAAGPESKVLAMDRDEEALDRARLRLEASGFAEQVNLVHSNFAALRNVALHHGYDQVDNVLMDLGFSTKQVDSPHRGFSFRLDGPLDMRMDRSQELTAADIVNSYTRSELTELIFRFGEEPQARRIANAIVRHRPFKNTKPLADTISEARKQNSNIRLHPATRTFQALRIAVNEELSQLQEALPQAQSLLAQNGRMCVISFHSLEDRTVKSFMHRQSDRQAKNKYAAESKTTRNESAPLELLYRRVVRPSTAEVQANPRSRSARMRAACKKKVGA